MRKLQSMPEPSKAVRQLLEMMENYKSNFGDGILECMTDSFTLEEINLSPPGYPPVYATRITLKPTPDNQEV